MDRNSCPQLMGSMRIIGAFAAIFFLLLPVSAQPIRAQDAGALPLHQRIDQLLTSPDAELPRNDVTESLLVRRLYLDLVGVPPSLAELELYLLDTAPNKFSILVDKLLNSPEFVEHWLKQLDLMLMERRSNTHVAQLDWEEFLRKSLTQRQPFNQLCAAILAANGAPGEQRAAGRFYLDRGGDPNLITRDVGRVFFGRDFQCAQCHDHPLIDSYFQADFQGIAAFFSGGYMVEVADGDKKVQVFGEKSLLESPYESVFNKGNARRTWPRIPGMAEVIPPSVQPGDDYEIAPADGVAAKPKYSRKMQLAQLATSGNSTAFNENWANRFWSLVFGRGIIQPADLIHADAESLQPELLPLLGTNFAGTGYDMRAFLRELVHTKLYRSGQTEPWEGSDKARTKEIVNAVDWGKVLTERQARWENAKSQLSSFGEKTTAAKDALLAIEKERTTLLAALDQTRAALIAALDAQSKAAAEVAAADKAIADEQAKLTKIQTAAGATEEVKTLLGQDAEVIKAAEVLQQRVAAVTATVTSLNNAAEEKRKALAAAQANTAAPKATWSGADQAVLAKNEAYAQADQNYVAMRMAEERARLISSSLKREVDYAKLVVAIKDSLREIEVKESELAALRVKKDSLVAEKTARSTALAQFEPQVTQAARDRDQAQEQVKVQQQRMQDVEAKRQLNLAAKESLEKLPDNQVDSLKSAQEEIARRLGELDGALATMQTDMQGMQANSVGAEKKLADLQAGRMSEQKSLTDLELELGKLDSLGQQIEQQKLAAEESYQRRLPELRQLRMERFEYAKLVALTPEQMAWSLLTALGFVERQIAAKLAELDKATPLTAEQQQDPAVVQQRKLQAYLQARKDLQGNVNVFVSLYGAGAGQPQGDFFATADQALFANNGGTIFSWAGAAGDNVTSKFIQSQNLEEATAKLYMALLGRSPTAEEVADVVKYINQAPDQKGALAQELVWGILTSAEFRFNH